MKRILSLLAATVLLASFAHAHFVWLERDDRGPAAFFGEWQARVRETEEGYLKLIASPRAFSSTGAPLQVTRGQDRLRIEDAPGDLRLTDTYLGEKGKQLSYYQARLGRTETVAKLDLELVPQSAGSNRFTLFLRGTPLPATDVTLYTSTGWNRTFRTDAAGVVEIETPWAGPAVIEVVHTETMPGEKDGRAYETVRHVFSLSFAVGR